MDEKDKAACRTMKRLRSKSFPSRNQNRITISPSYMEIRDSTNNNLGIQMEDIVVTVATGRVSEVATMLEVTCNLISSKI